MQSHRAVSLPEKARALALRGLFVVGLLALAACRQPTADVAQAPPVESSRVDAVPATTWERYVVVLPFEPRGEIDADLVAGLTEEIRKRITTLPSVVVISTDPRTLSVLNDVGVLRPPVENHFELIIDGSVEQTGQGAIHTRLRIMERGWEPAVWSREWSHAATVGELTSTQAEIAAEVNRVLGLPVAEADAVPPTKRSGAGAVPPIQRSGAGAVPPTQRSGAYDAYLRARGVPFGSAPARLREAIGRLERATAEDPGFSTAHAHLAELYSELLAIAPDHDGEIRGSAREALGRALDLAPESPQIQRASGRLHLATGESESALTALETATHSAPEDPDAWTALGRAHRDAGRPELARESWKRAFRLRPRGPLAVQLAEVAAALGDAEAADRWSGYAGRLGSGE